MSEKNIVVAIYKAFAYFPIPKGVDLEDKSVVEEWWVKRDNLYIKYVDGRFEEIENIVDNSDDMKYPEETKIAPAEEYGFSDDEEEENKN
jgi:hypothetical protein